MTLKQIVTETQDGVVGDSDACDDDDSRESILTPKHMSNRHQKKKIDKPSRPHLHQSAAPNSIQ
jgi:hypothetical protein